MASRSGIKIDDKVKIRLLDSELVQKDNFNVDLLQDTIELGEFSVERNTEIVKNYLKEEKTERERSLIYRNTN